jgi:hypothetical protein
MKIYSLITLILGISIFFNIQKVEAVNKYLVATAGLGTGSVQSWAGLVEGSHAVFYDVKAFFIDLFTKDVNRTAYNEVINKRSKYNLSKAGWNLLSGIVTITACWKLLTNND